MAKPLTPKQAIKRCKKIAQSFKGAGAASCTLNDFIDDITKEMQTLAESMKDCKAINIEC
jgi:hypothetical protein